MPARLWLVFRSLLALISFFLLPDVLLASSGETLDVPVWSILPFVLLLLAIALFPLLAEHFWQSNLRKALVALGIALPVVLYLVYLDQTERGPGVEKLQHAL